MADVDVPDVVHHRPVIGAVVLAYDDDIAMTEVPVSAIDLVLPVIGPAAIIIVVIASAAIVVARI
jgi:hypothetical protein